MEWYKEQCDRLDGKIIEFCKTENDIEKSTSICYVDKYDYYTYESDANTKKYAIIKAKKKITIFFIIVMIATFAIVYPLLYWEAVNAVVYEGIVYYALVYGNRILKTWTTLITIVGIHFAIYAPTIIITFAFTEVYPIWAEIWAHFMAGVVCYAVATIFLSKSGVIPRYLLGFALGVLYEVSEFVIYSTLHTPHLVYDPYNSIFDIFNHNTGACFAILVEYLVRRKDRKKYDESILNTDCL